MAAWDVVLVLGLVLIVAVAAVMSFTLKALGRTAEATRQIVDTLADIQSKTSVLAHLDGSGEAAERAAAAASQLGEQLPGNGGSPRRDTPA